MAILAEREHANEVESKITATKRARPAATKPLARHREPSKSLVKELQEIKESLAKAEFKVGLQTLRIAELENENAGLRSARGGTERLLQDEIRRLEKLVSDREEKIELLHKPLACL